MYFVIFVFSTWLLGSQRNFIWHVGSLPIVFTDRRCNWCYFLASFCRIGRNKVSLSVNRDNVLVWVIFVTTPRQKLPWIINYHNRFKIIFLRTKISTHNCLYESERTWNFEISKITSGRREEITVLFRVSESKLRQRFSLCHIRHDTEARTSRN